MGTGKGKGHADREKCLKHRDRERRVVGKCKSGERRRGGGGKIKDIISFSAR